MQVLASETQSGPALSGVPGSCRFSIAGNCTVREDELRGLRLTDAEVVQGGGADPNLQWEEAAHELELLSFSVDSGGRFINV